MKRMLINATHTDEIRVAIADGQKLYDLDIDSAGHYRKKGNIYKAKITRVEPSLEACFVNYGSERHGFLPYKEVSPSYCRKTKGKGRVPINEALKEGDEIIVQVNKEERGNKGAALSTYISLAGRYLVYMPGNHRAGGISRQIRGDKRTHLQDIMKRLEIPKNDGVIIRTAGLGRTFEELHWDFNYLKQVWEAIQTAADQKKGPFFIYQESDLFIRALRDYLQPDIGEILIDDRESYEKAREFMQQVMPHNLKKLSYYNDNTPLFSRYQIERQIQSAFEREVKLPSGGSLVIDQTEALLSIDINSAKATKGIDVETTALHTNLEAADEIARQLKIRDLGGLVVIDFIDMRNNKNQREVENRMRDAAESDRARVQIGKISKFGLLEMSRQRLRSSIADSSQVTCHTCGGHGFIRSMDSLVISIIRLTEEEMIKPKTGRIVIQAPVDTTNKILNEKRTELQEMEARHGVQVSVISNDNLSFPDFHVQRLNINESHINIDSIELVKPEDCHKAMSIDPPAPTKENPALRMVKPDIQAPKRSISLVISSWFKSLFSQPKKQKPKQGSQKKTGKKPQHKKPQNNRGQKPNQRTGNKKPQGQQSNRSQQNQRGSAQKQKPNQKSGPKPNQKQGQKPNQKQGQKPNQKQAGNQNNKPAQNQQDRKPQGQKGGQQNQPNRSNNKPANKGNQKAQQGGNNTNQNQAKKQQSNKPQQQADNKPVNQPETDANTVKKMTRPLGSVADLAAKKEPKVPSGAVKNRPIDQIDVESKLKSVDSTKQQQPKQQQPKQEQPKQEQPKQEKPKQEKPKQEQPKQEQPKQEKPQQEKPKQEKPKQEKPKQEKPQQEKPQQEKPKQEKPKQEKPQQEKPQQEKPQQEKPQQEKPKQEQPKQEKPKQEKPKQEKPQQEKPQQEKPKQEKPQQDTGKNKPPTTSAITAEMVKPGIYKAKKS